MLLTRIESREIAVGELDSTMRSRLLATTDAALRSEWEAALAAVTNSDREQVVQQYRSALTLPGDAERGGKVFGQRCANCHRLGQVGFEVGPNLASITDKSPKSLLANILDPSNSVEARYIAYNVLTTDGASHSGLLVTETGSSMTLLANDGKTETLLRNEIEEIRASGKSLMPEGLEKEMSPQDVADVIELLRSSAPGKHLE